MKGFIKLLRDERGTAVIETAIVAPVLVLMGLGAFESSMMVARHVELQNAAAEASQIALSSPPESAADMATLKAIIQASTGLGDSQVTLAKKYRCGTDTAYVDDETTCTDDFTIYVQVTLTETYTPLWAKIAFGSPVDYNIERLVQVG